MKPSKLVGAVALCAGLFGCGGGGGGGTPTMPAPPSSPPPPQSYTASVHDVFVLTQSKSETDDPISVDGGNGGSVTGSDETSDPMAVE
jgi:hypothetical protein